MREGHGVLRNNRPRVVMNRHGDLRFQEVERRDRILRSHREIVANRQERQIDRPESLLDVDEVRPICRIACEVDSHPARADDEAAPQRPIAIERRAR